MTVQQISIFVENKSGTLLKVLDLFKEAGIQLIASTISDTVEYGIYRIICSEPSRALETLKQAGIISYLYSFMLSGKGILIFRTDNPQKTEEVITEKGLQTLDDNSLLSMV